jgi:diguanylate cyclase (GGDEF)-like protein
MSLKSNTIQPAPLPSSDRYLRGMERLLQTVQELSLARELAEVQRIVRTAARELTGCDGATFVLRDNGQCYYADEDAIAPLWKGNRFPMEICISGWAMLNKRPAVIRDIYADPRIPHAAYRPTFVKSLVMVPIRQLDPIGAIGNYWAHEYQPTDEDVRLLQALADSTSIAMENVQVYEELEQRVRDRTAELERANAEIHHLSVTDEMTRLYNRRGFYVLAEQTLKEAHRRQLEYMLAYIDVDGLKRVNDEYGHDVGDHMIAAMADVLRKTLRQVDIIARMGGDEFCVIALDPRVDAETLEQRLKAEIDRYNRESGAPYTLAASIGAVCTFIDADTKLDILISLADSRMYTQKQSRRLPLGQR